MTDMAPTSSIPAELAACLQPYKSVLRRSVDVRRYESCVWLHGSPSGRVDADRRLMEALELLVLLARVDWRLWKQVVDTMVDSRASRREQRSDEQPVEVGVSFGSVSKWSDDLCEFLVTSSKSTLSSTAFQTSKELMLRVLSEQGQAVDEIPVRIPPDHAAAIDVQLLKMSQLVSRQNQFCEDARRAADAKATSTPFYCGLRFRAVDISDIHDRSDISVLGYAAQLASCGVTVQCLKPAFTKVQEQHPHEFMNAMIQLFPLDSQPKTRNAGGVACVSVSSFSLSKAYPAILSAVAASSCVNKIEFVPLFDEMGIVIALKHRRWLWSWLAYSAFLQRRGAGQHHIQEIWINATWLDQHAANAMTHVLQAANPVAALLDREGSDAAPESVSASRFALRDPSSGCRLVKWSCGQCFDSLPVIERTDEWVSVLLPRWGQAWVHRDDILPSQSPVATTSQLQSIPDVMLDDVQEPLRQSAVALLRLVGQGIRHQEVTAVPVRFREGVQRLDWDALCPEIFKACPVLESLTFYGDTMKLDTLHCILDAFATGLCRLQRLCLQSDNFTGGSDSLPPLINALSNRHHPVRHLLTEIALVGVPFASTMQPTVISSCVAMLKENVVLQRLDFRFQVPKKHRAQFAACVAQLKVFDNERIDGKREQILAFLSAVAANCGQGEITWACKQLDAHVVSLIFAFATPSFIRQVTIMEDT